ncbi:MAG: hypothetical protein ACLR0N_15225 [Bilophila wadsworthia]
MQSNHCRLTPRLGRQGSLDCHLVLEERVKDSYNPKPRATTSCSSFSA